jgi:hypothetical protein
VLEEGLVRHCVSEGKELSDEALDRLVVEQYPYPIAANYRRLLALKGWEERTRKCLQVFEYGMRAVTLNVLSQYLIRDVHRVREPNWTADCTRGWPKPAWGNG